MPSKIFEGMFSAAELEDFSTPLFNIQFHITAVKDLKTSSSPSSTTAPHWFFKLSPFYRVVHITIQGDRYIFKEHTDGVPEASSMWNENTTQFGPLRESDRVTFRIVKRLSLSLPGQGMTIATSKEYTLGSLLLLQGKTGPKKDIQIPLTSFDDANATLSLQVREPTTSFISKRWVREAKHLQRKLQELQITPQHFIEVA